MSEKITNIETDKATLPGGHYSQATVANGFVFVSGQLGFKPGTKDYDEGASIEEQTLNCLNNTVAILEGAGSDKSKIVKTTVYISDGDYWPRVNAVYQDFFGNLKPARAIVPVKDLHYGFGVEIETVAVL